jgi:ADP-ribosylglycohydrolase
VPKVHNKPIKRPRKGFKQREQKTSQRHPGLAHRTVRCTRALEAKLATFGNFQARSAIIHRTVRCASGATATSRATVDCNALNARLRAQRTEDAQLAHRTVYRTCSVHHRTAQRPHKSELQQSNPNGLLTWLAHRTVSGAPCDSTLPTAIFGGWGYKYPNHPTFNDIQVSQHLHLTRAIVFNTRHTKEIKSSPNSTQSFSD